MSDRLTRGLRRRLAGAPGVRERRAVEAAWHFLPERPAVYLAGDRLRILHREAECGTGEPAGVPRLWRYHRHYFDDVASGHFAADVARWMAGPEDGTGWEPYPLSRRIPNWIIWLLRGNAPVAGMVESLARQTRALERQIERHLQANHLLANWRALVFAHSYFQGDAVGMAREWTRELERQLLADGGHQERSPMYHALILTDLLDLVQLAACYPVIAREAGSWRRQAALMLGWLTQLTHPDQRIAFFQDAAFDMAPPVGAIGAYARQLGVEPVTQPLGASGYGRLAQGSTVVLLDAGSPGPAHQPGHAHAGALGFELSYRGARLLVQSGTSTYEPGPERLWERSTAAHNTLRLDGRDQSELWAAFRLGRRAEVWRSEASDGISDGFSGGSSDWFAARHNGYAPVEHERRWRLEPGALMVEDRLAGTGEHRVELFFHLHPDVSVSPGFRCRHAGGAELQFQLPLAGRVEATTWRPEFGLHVPNRTIVAEAWMRLPASFTTRIELL